MYSTEISRHVNAPRSAVYRALLDADLPRHFARIVPDEQVVEVFEFETDDEDLRGTMTMTTTLTDVDGGTDVVVLHEGIPDSVLPADNETGTRMALANLAKLVESS
jgi:uncharacterized protein YndB with AHSA1/START domain